MKVWVKAALTMVLFFLWLYPQHPQNVAALSCAELPFIEDAYEKYDGVIIGKVKEVVRRNDSNQVKLSVLKSYKAISQTSLTVKEDPTWGAVWGPSEVGQEYLFFLRQNAGGWENPLCAPTKKIEDAAEELKFLQDKEISLVSVAEPMGSDGNRDSHASSIIWIIVIFVCLLVVMGYSLFRMVKRGK